MFMYSPVIQPPTQERNGRAAVDAAITWVGVSLWLQFRRKRHAGGVVIGGILVVLVVVFMFGGFGNFGGSKSVDVNIKPPVSTGSTH